MSFRDHGFRRLVEFAAREGHAKVPATHIEPDGFRLGRWVSYRRTDYRLGRLSAERIVALEGVPGWVWDAVDNDWQQGLAALRAFAAREGHAKVPVSHLDPQSFSLGSWVSSRRTDYRIGRLPVDRIAALETVPGWMWSLHDEVWEQGLAALQNFVVREGHAKVPTTHIDADRFTLGKWVSSRRNDYRAGRLPAERIAALETLQGWVWNVMNDGWKQGMSALQAFAVREGHAKVPTSHVDACGFTLGRWVSARRNDYRVGGLPAERIAALETVPGWVWTTRSDSSKKAIDMGRRKTGSFLALTKNYGWIVLQPAQVGAWSGYQTVPGKYGLAEKDVLARADLPPIPATT